MVTTDTTNVRLPSRLVESVRVIARAHDRSLSAELRVALDEYARRMLPGARRLLDEREQR
jgi:hypothetical protein